MKIFHTRHKKRINQLIDSKLSLEQELEECRNKLRDREDDIRILKSDCEIVTDRKNEVETLYQEVRSNIPEDWFLFSLGEK